MARSQPRRRLVTDLFADLTDDVKVFVDDEIVDRAATAEREQRRAVRRLARDDRRPAARDEHRSEINELKSAVAELTEKVARLANARKLTRDDADGEGAP